MHLPPSELCGALALEAWLFSGLLEGNASGDDAPVELRFEKAAGARGVRCSASRISASLGGPPGVDILVIQYRRRPFRGNCSVLRQSRDRDRNYLQTGGGPDRRPYEEVKEKINVLVKTE